MTLKTLDNALTLLSYFTVHKAAWGVRELAKQSGVHPAVVQRVLATFAANGYLVQHPETSKYALGLRVFELGHIARKTIAREDLVRPVLEQLAEQCGETVFLSLLDGHEGLCIGMVQSQHPLRFSIEPGERFALLAGAHAKALLAFAPDAVRAEVYRQSADRGATRARMEPLLMHVREQGWAYTYGEAAEGVAGLAVPLWSPDHTAVVGSVAIAGPRERIGAAGEPRFIRALQDASQRLEHVTGTVHP